MTKEKRLFIVVCISIITMLAEIITGLLFESMALLAGGLHMASHVIAFSIASFAYAYAKKHADSNRFCFGTGKINALAGFSGAVILLLLSLHLCIESMEHFFEPVDLIFDQVWLVPSIALLVSLLSAFILKGRGEHKITSQKRHMYCDCNYRSVYMHILADVLTSLFFIIALFFAEYLGLNWLDRFAGWIGAVIVARWAIVILRQSGNILLDKQVSDTYIHSIRKAFEELTNTKVCDIIVWSIGGGEHATIIQVESLESQKTPFYKKNIQEKFNISYIYIEMASN